jgi:2-phosphoglycolate phosphatase
MNRIDRYRVIIFDLDGTLIDSWPSLLRTVHACLPGCPLDESALRRALSAGIGPMLRLAAEQATDAPAQQAEIAEALQSRYLRDFLLSAPLYAGVAEWLDELQHAPIRLGVCTNRDRASSLGLLEQHGLHVLQAHLVGLGDVAHAKPHPQPLLTCLEQLGVGANDALFVGDSVVDAQCAQAAGVDFAAHLGGYHAHPDELAGAALRFASYGELRRWLQG